MDTDPLYLALAENNCMIVYEVRKGRSGNCYAAMMRSLQTLAPNSFPGRGVLNNKDRVK